ncbi:Adenylate cyclase [Geitlerinema sp. FC II]|nr:adenylate/guanylate cyclase domain-containing protein [Geitlerinema sp. CS-897]PPT06962.1 Adenylate cyclase [Geitlerinema sp. FC II]
MQRTATKLFVFLQNSLYHHTVAVLSLLLAIGAAIAFSTMAHISSDIIEMQALQNARLYAQAIRESRTLYSSEAVGRASSVEGIAVTHDYLAQPGAIPLPATFLIELGQRIRDNNPGVSVRLYSNYPFPWRQETGGPQDEFEREAIAYLQHNPDDQFTRIETLNQRLSFRYARADILRPSCVGCHNRHPDSPKRDWKIGDVRGILEIVQPLDDIKEQVRHGLQTMALLVAAILGLAVTGFTLVVGRLRGISRELERRVVERTAQLVESNEELINEREKSERLLLNILPAPIAERLKENPDIVAEGFGEVTILFADICGFTALSSRVSPEVLVAWLNEIFSSFDRLTEQYGLEKIKTIGDAYMAVGGLPLQMENHVEAVADLALAMQREINKLNRTLDEPLQLRVGIETGSVVAGVIGIKKFIYDLWGDAVNVASRMESSGLPGKIQVTEATYHRLKHRYRLELRGTVTIKGKGEMTTYWLLGQQDIRSLSCREAFEDSERQS